MRGPALLIAISWGSLALAQDLPRKVEGERELPFVRAVKTQELTRAELRALQAHNFHDEYGDGVATERAWQALGLLPPGTNLRDLTLANKETRVLGMYLFEPLGEFRDGRMYVIPENISASGSPTREVQAHELAHALSDQHHDLGAMFDQVPNTPGGGRDADATAALMALEEGTATAVGLRVDDPYVDLGNWSRGRPFSGLPWHQAKGQFLYVAGLDFVQHLRAQGDWDGVDAAYASPPTSTEQVLHPERYRRDQPTAVELPDPTRALPGDWRVLDRNSLGELGTRWLTDAGAGSGWDGDQYVVMEDTRTGQVIALASSTWDSPRDAAEFFVRRAGALDPPIDAGETVHVEQEGAHVHLVAGARPEQLPALLELFSRVRRTSVPGDENVPGTVPTREDGVLKIAQGSTHSRALVERNADGTLSTVTTLTPDAAGRALVAQARERFEQGGWTEVAPGRHESVVEAQTLVIGVSPDGGTVTIGVGPTSDSVASTEATLTGAHVPATASRGIIDRIPLGR